MRTTLALRATAYHEAGHAVAAFSLGVRTKSLSIVPDGGSAGRHVHQAYFAGIKLEFDRSARAQRRAENMALVCLAGPAAQRRFNPRTWRHWHGAADFRQAADLLERVSSSGEEVDAYLWLIEIRAKQFVSLPAHWAMIRTVTRALLAERELSGDRVVAEIRSALASAR